MITEDLIAYIQAQLRKNISVSIITSRLIDAGWHSADVAEAFRKIAPPVVAPAPIPVVTTSVPVNITPVEKKDGPDLYRESVGQDREGTILHMPESFIKKTVPTEVKPVFSQSFSEANPKPSVLSVAQAKQQSTQAPTETRLEVRSEELMPSLIPKAVPRTTPTLDSAVKPTPKPPLFSDLKMSPTPTPKPMTDIKIISDSPNNAILHSYPRAMLSANKVNVDLPKKKSHTMLKWVLIIFLLSAIGGSVFAISGNYIKLPSFNFSFVKKDPKSLLISSPIALDELKAYKIETIADITMPTFADITSGLVNGEAVSSDDTDSLSFVAQGIVNHSSGASPIFDYRATFKSSLFKNDIVTDLKYNNLISLITTPDLSELLGVNAPEVSTVIVPKGQFGSFIALLPDNIAGKVKKVDIDKLFSVGVPAYINKETESIFKEFIDSATVVEKEIESIKGVESHHYGINADKVATKKFLSHLIDVFIVDLSKEEKDILDERLGAITLDSFEVWIGKDDNKIHQYSFTLKTPLSRLIGLEDKGIAGNVVSLNWKTTYYDFNIHNEISTPAEALGLPVFMKKVSDMKIKDKVSSFKILSDNLRNALGKYGKSSNSTGSCMNPSPGSLFSPSGHTKGASNAVGDIASLMNELINMTGGTLSCYSSPSAWALAVPLASNPTSSFCADSTGVTVVLDTQLLGPVCK